MQNRSLSELAKLVGGTPHNLSDELAISALTCDSRKVVQGALFIAVQGSTRDGHRFIDQAFENGAAACMVQDRAAAGTHPCIVVESTAQALSRLAAHLEGDPSADLFTVGITGTNGKTTTNWLIWSMLNQLGYPCIRIGTLGMYYSNDLQVESTLTTPDPIELQVYLRRAKDAGARAAVLEVSSHALAQSRVDDVRFDIGIFTNLSRDHLDYHGDMQTYLGAKLRLFDLIFRNQKEAGGAIINIDAPYAQEFLLHCRKLGVKVISLGKDPNSELKISSFLQSGGNSCLEVEYRNEKYAVHTSFLGEHNAYNLISALAVGISLGYSPNQVSESLACVKPVPGRLEQVGDETLSILVDYAHTPDALENVLSSLRSAGSGRLWVVFGCGGDRDRGKRPQMAEIALRLADRVVVTSDNPRTEDPRAIIADILDCEAGPAIQKGGIIELDRRKAIFMAVSQAAPGDTVLIAGKGHEDYQIIGEKKIHFSDQEEARKALKARLEGQL
ncbi:MAG: UDP-N-acetylmuramoyl-L-alanyl-D-glutamate--2,6-diaminopimelate ligase [Proteobacteria bacterium]|nr:MAG: UDP-N-acetylmuramoyl-L-alanyl-D-glutamate--2,6-diaminopimelate ligase [Pseudomonadota bacterium]